MKSSKRSNVVGSMYPSKDNFSVIIPTASMGRRMKSYGPKSLIKVGGESVLDRQIRLIKKVFKNRAEIIVVSGFEKEKFKSYESKVKVFENEDYANSNVVKSLGIGLEGRSHENVLIIYGDLVFNQSAITAPFGYYSMLIIDKNGTMNPREAGCVIQKNKVERVMYGLDHKWAQIGFFRGRELDLLEEFCKKPKNARCFGFEALNFIIENGGIFSGFSPKGIKVMDIDCSKDIKLTEEML